MRLNTLNLTEEKVGNWLELSGTRKDSLNRKNTGSTAQALRTTINKWTLTILKSLRTAKDIIWAKRQTTEWEKMFLPATHLIEGQYLKYIKNSKKLDFKKTNNPI